MSESFLAMATARAHDSHCGASIFQHARDTQGYGSDAMRSLVSAFSDAFNDSGDMPSSLPQIPTPSGPPPLGSILQLVKETGKSRKECKAALVASANDCDAARWALTTTSVGEADP